MTNKCVLKSMLLTLLCTFLFHGLAVGQPAYDMKRLKREKLGRGLMALKKDQTTNFLTWRYLSEDPLNISFNVYRNGKKVNDQPVTTATCYTDYLSGPEKCVYTIKAILNGREIDCGAREVIVEADAPYGYIPIPLNIPEGGVTPSGQSYNYIANDATVGDVDGDGEYEIILKWSPSNAHDNSHAGYSGNVYIDCYKLDGTQLWRIDLGRNIRAGAHYTQVMVYDLDGDGKAELVLKTADGTIDGKGNCIGNPDADYRNERGYILDGPEFLTVFSGLTGEALQTILYEPARGNVADWGDKYGNRVDRFLACIAYLDGEYPSVIMCRGYYTRTVLVAYDWRDGKLHHRWTFDSDTPGNEAYAGQGNHNLRVGDVDGDGCDEIIYGSCAINNDGTGLYSTGMGHGDAIHMTAFFHNKRELQVWDCHENKRDGSTFREAATGEILFQQKDHSDVGRCMAADIDPDHPGLEMWSTRSGGIRNVKGEIINSSMRGVSFNMACWWDGDLLRELQDGTEITKYNHRTGEREVLLSAGGCASNNSSKRTPCLVADITGDWREELLLRTWDNSALRLYISTYETDYRFHTFLEDPVYRISVATQNVGYNQPAQPGFYFGADLGKCFYDKEQVVYGDTITLDVGMDYDEVRWSTGDTGRQVTLTTRQIPLNQPSRVEVEVVYRGCIFRDSLCITFRDGQPAPKGKKRKQQH